VPALPSSVLEPLWVQFAALLPTRQVPIRWAATDGASPTGSSRAIRVVAVGADPGGCWVAQRRPAKQRVQLAVSSTTACWDSPCTVTRRCQVWKSTATRMVAASAGYNLKTSSAAIRTSRTPHHSA
jgi:hypothetical protein